MKKIIFRGCAAIIFCLLSILCMTGCDPGFEEPQNVIDLRLLAVSAEPPEIVIPLPDPPPAGSDTEQTGNIQKGFDEFLKAMSAMTFGPFTFTWLFADPQNPDRDLAYIAYVCALSEKKRCDDESARTVAAQGTAKPGELSFQVNVTGEQLIAAQKADMYFGFFGIPVYVELVLGQGDETVHGVKAITISFKNSMLAPDRMPNRNPAIDSIQDVTEMKTVKTIQKVGPPVPLDGTWKVKAGQKILLLTVPSGDCHEHFFMPSFEGTQVEDDEEFRYFYLSDRGRFSKFHTSEIDFRKYIMELPENYVKDVSSEWQAPAEAGTATLWFIVHDRRGGSAWKTVKVQVE